MKPLNIAFFWHMHQPMYKDPIKGVYTMPWVRLHGIKGYFDMISLLEEFPEIHQTFNLVPSLIVQINDYVSGGAKDIFWDHSIKSAVDLELNEKKFILDNFFMCNWGTMIQQHTRYWELLKKRGMRHLTEDEIDHVAKIFSLQEYLDLQVLFNLTWFGYKSVEKDRGLLELIKKGRNFTEDEKRYVLETQIRVLKELLPAYKRFQDKGQVEITTSPFYHPILPLLYDTELAHRCMPGANLPDRFNHPEDAEEQIKRGVALYRDTFGREPSGMWPSEGSVAPELIPFFQKAGIRWIATDEAILLNSISEDDRGRMIYKPYRARFKDTEINIIFRDKGLSDLIGFTYSKNLPEQSKDDFMGHLKSIQRYLADSNDDHIVNIILDGENAWEYYPDGGRGFLSLVYKELTDDKSFKTVKIGEYIDGHKPVKIIETLSTGSWINSNFKIWIGTEEDNKGWDYIKKTRRFLTERIKENSINRKKAELAWEEIYMAEGSDWFWWYGDDFSSDNDAEFDRLFRSHLENVYRIIGVEPPDYLKIPIIKVEEELLPEEPVKFISPMIDGKITNYFEWLGAGSYTGKVVGSSMYHAEEIASAIFYGFDLHNLFLRLDMRSGLEKDTLKDIEVNIHIFNKDEFKIVFPLVFKEGEKKKYSIYRRREGLTFSLIKADETLAIKNIVEIAISFKDLNLEKNDVANFFVEFKKDKLEIDRYPRHKYITFKAPDENFENVIWSA
ncbi:MAG: glycoside hydrolase family 57 protein [Nitrospinota bacterium]